MAEQDEAIALLANPARYPGVDSVQHIETHTAHVFLAGDFAFKLKRAVTYDFLDFSTIEKRRVACEAEVAINRRTAPDLYLRVEPVGNADQPLDWVVVMRRFDEDGLYDRLASRKALTLAMARELADEVSRLHGIAEPRSEFGGESGMRWVVDRNAVVFEEYADTLPADLSARVTSASLNAITRHTAMLESRRQSGRVRQCHGDLHLRNIVAIAGRPVIFDAIEFNDRISCTDVLYDLAFLVMDLLQFELADHASALFNRYLEGTDELEGLALMPLFLATRAAVRAKVTAIEVRLEHSAGGGKPLGLPSSLAAEARAYLEQAEAFLRTSPPRLIAVGGLSGSGKSTLAARLAPGLGIAPGAVVFRSDIIRKRLFGVAPETRLGPEGYTPSANRDVYAALVAQARTAMAAGYSVIADAVFANADDRAAIEQAARDLDVPFTGLWLEAPPDILRARVTARTNDASDATAVVVDRQLASAPDVTGWRAIDASGTEETILATAKAVALQIT